MKQNQKKTLALVVGVVLVLLSIRLAVDMLREWRVAAELRADDSVLASHVKKAIQEGFGPDALLGFGHPSAREMINRIAAEYPLTKSDCLRKIRIAVDANDTLAGLVPLAVVIIVLPLVLLGPTQRKAAFPGRRAYLGALAGIRGVLVGVAIAVLVLGYKYIAPVNSRDIDSRVAEFAGEVFAVQGTVQDLAFADGDQHLIGYYLDGGFGVLANKEYPTPEKQKKVWCLGKGVVNNGHGITLMEYFRIMW